MAPKSKLKAKDGKSLASIPMMAVSTSQPSTREAKARERRYRAEEALSVLKRAAEFQNDRRVMADVKRLAADEAAKMSRIAKR